MIYWTSLKGNLSSNLFLFTFTIWNLVLCTSWCHESLTASVPSPLFFTSLHFFPIIFLIPLCFLYCYFYFFFRNYMSLRRLSRPWSTQFHLQHPITLRFGLLLRPHTAMSARGCCGVLPAKACAVLNVVSNATRSARTSSMQIAYKVRNYINLYINTSS